MDELLIRTLDYLTEKGAEYVDIRVERKNLFTITMNNGVIESATRALDVGCGVRVLIGGSWGFAISNDITKKGIRNISDLALSIAKHLRPYQKKPIELVDTKAIRTCFTTKAKRPIQDVSLDEKIDYITEINDRAQNMDDRIVNIVVKYGDLILEKNYVNTDGAKIKIKLDAVDCSCNVTGKQGDRVESARGSICGSGGWELLKKEKDKYIVDTAVSRFQQLIKAKRPRAGKYTVILDPFVVGVLTHESFGHMAEADNIIRGGSALKGKLNEKLGSELVTIVDNGNVDNSIWVPYDDDGVKASKTTIVNKGVLTGFLHNRSTAAELHTDPTGNCRAKGYSYLPMVRMTNTYMEKGTWDIEELISDTKNGIYVTDSRGGSASIDGYFYLTTTVAYNILNGEIKDSLKNIALSGHIFTYLKNVDAVCKDIKIFNGGIFGACGKSYDGEIQHVPVGQGGPHVRILNAIIGGR